MSFSMQRLRSLLPGGNHHGSTSSTIAPQRHSVCLEPEIGFQISINAVNLQNTTTVSNCEGGTFVAYHKTTVPELNVHLIAARHLPTLFGFKIVQGYLIKVKLFPGSKRLDSSVQTNSWPKFNETFKFPLAPDIKPTLKHSLRCGSKGASDVSPEDLFAGQFVVFTVYALLELPPASFNRVNKTYRSLRDKGSNLVQKVVESSSVGAKSKESTNDTNNVSNGKSNITQKAKSKSSGLNPKDSMPPLTISESRRNIGSVTCYLEPKLFKRSSRTGLWTTEELWFPIKDIATTIPKGVTSNLTNATKGIVELALEIHDLSQSRSETTERETKNPMNSISVFNENNMQTKQTNGDQSPPTTSFSTPSIPVMSIIANGIHKQPQWIRMTSEVKRKMGITSIGSSDGKVRQHDFVLRVTTARMRCNSKVKDELESTAGSVYVKTTVFDHGIYVDSWKSCNFYPSLSIKWDLAGTDVATLCIPMQSLECLENILIRTTLATKTKMGKKIVLGTILVGAPVNEGSGAEHVQLLRETPVNERVAMWHCYQ